jgi:hypothetical protein
MLRRTRFASGNAPAEHARIASMRGRAVVGVSALADSRRRVHG